MKKNLQEGLRRAGQRVTPQREAVYKVLCGSKSHPTAEELFLEVRRQTAGISMATVYNTLEALVACSLAKKLPGDGPARYDAECEPHGHTRCLSCGVVSNLPATGDFDLLEKIALPKGFAPENVTIEVVGVCGPCKASS